MLYFLAIPPVLVMLAIYLGVVSVMERRDTPRPNPGMQRTAAAASLFECSASRGRGR